MTRSETVDRRTEEPPRRGDVGIIVNPKHALTHRAYVRLIAGLRDRRVRYRTMTTTTARSGRWQAEQLVDWGAEAVIILGGDGTVRAAAPVLAAAGVLTFILPTGTANVLSRHVGFRSPRQAMDHCLHTLRTAADPEAIHRRGVPVNTAEYTRADGSREHTHFISLAGIGGDARAVSRHHLAPGLLGYAWGAARSLFGPELDLNADTAGTAWSVMASKTARPAGPVTVFPDAEIDDDKFSVLTVGPLPAGAIRRLQAWTTIASACLQGTPLAHPLMRYRRAASVSVTLSEAAPAQLDGDLIGDCLELHLSAGDRVLWVSAPAS